MDQKSIGLYLNRKGWTARVIHDDLVATFGMEAIAYSTMTKYLREAQTGPDEVIRLSEEISPHIEDSDEAILSALEQLTFSSVRQLSRATHLPATRVYRTLRETRVYRASSPMGATHPLGGSGGITRPVFTVPSYDTAGTTHQSLARHRDSG
jgi:hypothetical protein